MTSEAELVAPEWKVYFDGDFWGHRGKDRAGKEIKLDKQFDWAGYHWVIPAAYSCSKGLVVDFCMRVDSESIRDFMKNGIWTGKMTHVKILPVSNRCRWNGKTHFVLTSNLA